MLESDRRFETRMRDLEDKLLTDPPMGEVALEVLRSPMWRDRPIARRHALKVRTAELIKQNPPRKSHLTSKAL